MNSPKTLQRNEHGKAAKKNIMRPLSFGYLHLIKSISSLANQLDSVSNAVEAAN